MQKGLFVLMSPFNLNKISSPNLDFNPTLSSHYTFKQLEYNKFVAKDRPAPLLNEGLS